MKKCFLFIVTAALVAALLLTFTACGEKSDDNSSSDSKKTEQTEALTEEPTQSEEAVIKELQDELVGNWTFYNFIYKETSNHLVFNADGTGSYQGGVVENGQYEYDYTFTYTISLEPNKYATNGFDNTLHIKYNEIDDSEDRKLSFIEGKLYLAYGDHTIIQYDEYTREEDVPKE